MSRLQVEVCCDLCAPYPAGRFEEPLPGMFARWALSTWRVEQALHHAHGCDGAVRLRVRRTAAVDGTAPAGASGILETVAHRCPTLSNEEAP